MEWTVTINWANIVSGVRFTPTQKEAILCMLRAGSCQSSQSFEYFGVGIHLVSGSKYRYVATTTAPAFACLSRVLRALTRAGPFQV